MHSQPNRLSRKSPAAMSAAFSESPQSSDCVSEDSCNIFVAFHCMWSDGHLPIWWPLANRRVGISNAHGRMLCATMRRVPQHELWLDGHLPILGTSQQFLGGYLPIRRLLAGALDGYLPIRRLLAGASDRGISTTYG